MTIKARPSDDPRYPGPKGGRPRKAPEEKRVKVSIYLSLDEYRLALAGATYYGISLAEYFRRQLAGKTWLQG